MSAHNKCTHVLAITFYPGIFQNDQPYTLENVFKYKNYYVEMNDRPPLEECRTGAIIEAVRYYANMVVCFVTMPEGFNGVPDMPEPSETPEEPNKGMWMEDNTIPAPTLNSKTEYVELILDRVFDNRTLPKNKVPKFIWTSMRADDYIDLIQDGGGGARQINGTSGGMS